ncbi:Hypothetical predicted protein [Podarcis lilfordi]|uniref:Uncharacterized protein n=1 Tax=Podarcis lilfordi TaxID=74358 RepID=A0AA35P851_9SAUR|nr:Hypothetical predicted protein [Podarcis lilfordi]
MPPSRCGHPHATPPIAVHHRRSEAHPNLWNYHGMRARLVEPLAAQTPRLLKFHPI